MSATQTAEETWLPIPGFDGYQASSLGSVRNAKTGSVLKQRDHCHGYARLVTLTDGGKRIVKTVHRLVGRAFFGELPTGFETCHIDSDFRNNAASNLRYGSKASNEADKRIAGTNPVGERNGRAKLNAKQVAEIRNSGSDISQLAEKYRVSPVTIRKVCAFSTWRAR